MAPWLLLALLASPPAGPRFVEDDFPRALALARGEKKLLFVDAWAPWCHTCVYLREHVLSRPGFAAYQKDVVFAALDTEKPSSAAFLAEHPVDVLPTLFFIDPRSGAVLFKWLGTTDEAQMHALLEAAGGGSGPVAVADGLFASGDAHGAAGRYLASLRGRPVDQSPAREVLSTLSALAVAKSYDACAETAVERLASLGALSERVNGLTWGLGCALELPPSPQRARLLAPLVEAGRAALGDVGLGGVLADDVSGLYEVLVTAAEGGEGADPGAALARRWLAFLEGEAAKASTPAGRAVFDAHRVAAALAAKRPEVMVEPLQRSERELPLDYNPPARLALVYRELGRLDEAGRAIDRALGLCRAGPRKLRLYEVKASVLEKAGQPAARKAVLEEMVAYARKLPLAQLPRERLAALERRVAELAR